MSYIVNPDNYNQGDLITMPNGILYQLQGDYWMPYMEPQPSTKSLGHWGMKRKAYLQTYREILFSNMLLGQTLFPHLEEIDQTAEARMEALMEQLLQSQPAPDKATQQMAWVGHMNNLKAQAEEVILSELIYV